MSNSYSTLNDEAEDVENVYDESANLFSKTKIGGNSYSTATADRGSEKAPGPDGFMFKFYKTQWDTIAPDVMDYIREFEMTSFLPRGCNSSFIALVPKVKDPLVRNDFRPISLIGSQYKILAKILANRLAMVIPSVVSEAQTVFIKGRQIIDGLLVVDEIILWAKVYKKKLFMLKVDFEKAFDTLSWSLLDSIMDQMGFTSKWGQWIFACLISGYASVLVNGSPTSEFKIERILRQGDPFFSSWRLRLLMWLSMKQKIEVYSEGLRWVKIRLMSPIFNLLTMLLSWENGHS
ncbi:cysteine-rich receptor-like protein kinase [Tanacetum coccineum]